MELSLSNLIALCYAGNGLGVRVLGLVACTADRDRFVCTGHCLRNPTLSCCDSCDTLTEGYSPDLLGSGKC